jgi:Spy/CpxP family protein refolding chaperone
VREKHTPIRARRGRVTMLRQMRSVQDKYDDQIATILTREQAQVLKKIKEERRSSCRVRLANRR